MNLYLLAQISPRDSRNNFANFTKGFLESLICLLVFPQFAFKCCDPLYLHSFQRLFLQGLLLKKLGVDTRQFLLQTLKLFRLICHMFPQCL